MKHRIRSLQLPDLSEAGAVIRRAFAPVAAAFDLTSQNCPGNGAFISLERLEKDWARGVSMAGLFNGDRMRGFVAWKPRKASSIWYIEKLAVVPEAQGLGFGSALLGHAVEHIVLAGGTGISIGIINDNLALSAWYERRGFIRTGTRQFPNLPFLTCYLERACG